MANDWVPGLSTDTVEQRCTERTAVMERKLVRMLFAHLAARNCIDEEHCAALDYDDQRQLLLARDLYLTPAQLQRLHQWLTSLWDGQVWLA